MTCTIFSKKQRKKWPVRLPFFYHIRYFLSCLSSCVPWTKQATSGVLIWVFIFLRSKLSPLAIGAHIIPVWIRFIPAQDCLADLYYCTVHACAATVLLNALTLLRLLTATYGRSCLVPVQRLPCVQYKDEHMICHSSISMDSTFRWCGNVQTKGTAPTVLFFWKTRDGFGSVQRK